MVFFLLDKLFFVNYAYFMNTEYLLITLAQSLICFAPILIFLLNIGKKLRIQEEIKEKLDNHLKTSDERHSKRQEETKEIRQIIANSQSEIAYIKGILKGGTK